MRTLLLLLRVPAAQDGTCRQEQETRKMSREQARVSFRLPGIPRTISSGSLRKAYLVENFWLHYDFGDENMLRIPEITEEIFSTFAMLLRHVPENVARKGIRNLVREAGKNSRTCKAFMELCRKYFYAPGAPALNDVFYAQALNEAINLEQTEQMEKTRYGNYLLLLRKNQPGTPAADFTFTLDNGDQKRLYALNPPLLLLYINNPALGACQHVQEYLAKSKVINHLLSQGNLQVLAVYPDEDLTAWKANLKKMPESWINAYDGRTVIRAAMRYDLKAMPTIYLLDENKTVILKDASAKAVEDWLIDHNEKPKE